MSPGWNWTQLPQQSGFTGMFGINCVCQTATLIELRLLILFLFFVHFVVCVCVWRSLSIVYSYTVQCQRLWLVWPAKMQSAQSIHIIHEAANGTEYERRSARAAWTFDFQFIQKDSHNSLNFIAENLSAGLHGERRRACKINRHSYGRERAFSGIQRICRQTKQPEHSIVHCASYLTINIWIHFVNLWNQIILAPVVHGISISSSHHNRTPAFAENMKCYNAVHLCKTSYQKPQ